MIIKTTKTTNSLSGPHSTFTRFIDEAPADPPQAYELLTQYSLYIPLLLRDLEFQLIEAQDRNSEGLTSEERLLPYALTLNGIKRASKDIGAFRAGRKAERLEKAARAGDFDFIKKNSQSFLDYMELFMAELEESLVEEEQRTAQEEA
jgi:hypothetical protein